LESLSLRSVTDPGHPAADDADVNWAASGSGHVAVRITVARTTESHAGAPFLSRPCETLPAAPRVAESRSQLRLRQCGRQVGAPDVDGGQQFIRTVVRCGGTAAPRSSPGSVSAIVAPRRDRDRKRRNRTGGTAGAACARGRRRTRRRPRRRATALTSHGCDRTNPLDNAHHLGGAENATDHRYRLRSSGSDAYTRQPQPQGCYFTRAARCQRYTAI
jgi:hypothetical protein